MKVHSSILLNREVLCTFIDIKTLTAEWLSFTQGYVHAFRKTFSTAPSYCHVSLSDHRRKKKKNYAAVILFPKGVATLVIPSLCSAFGLNF